MLVNKVRKCIFFFNLHSYAIVCFFLRLEVFSPKFTHICPSAGSISVLMMWKNSTLFPEGDRLVSRPVLSCMGGDRERNVSGFSIPSCVLYFLLPGFYYNLLLLFFLTSCHAVQLQRRRNAEMERLKGC